jgi:hypothetical protein
MLCAACIRNKVESSFVINKEIVLIVEDNKGKSVQINSYDEFKNLFSIENKELIV